MSEARKEDDSLFRLFDQTITALQHESILVKGGVTAYAVYTVAVLLALVAILQVITNTVALITQLIGAFIALLIAGILGGVAIEYVKFKKSEAAGRFQSDRLKLKLELASKRSSSVLEFFKTWESSNPAGFATLLQNDPMFFADSLDNIYSELGVRGTGLRRLLTELGLGRTPTNPRS